MKKVLVSCLLVLLVACSKEKELGNMLVKGKIKGLKKGTLYLQKMNDSILVTLDSINLFGTNDFVLTDNITSSEMYYLTLSGQQNRISFFGQEGTITINDKLEKFGISPEIEGSKNQIIYEEYKNMVRKFQGKQLDLLAENVKAQKENDLEKSEALRKQSDKQILKKYIYTINYVLNHPDAEASAYITLTELVNANIKYLDSINNSLTSSVKNSIYGKELAAFVEEIKKTEN